MKYLVDSDWIIDGLAGIRTALIAIRQNAPDGLAISIITVGEVLEGAYGFPDPPQQLAEFRQFLGGFRVFGLTSSTMEIVAQQRFQLRKQGNLIPDSDLLIACTALEHGLIVMSRNTRHFSRVPGLVLYR